MITENEDGSCTYTPDDFVPCQMGDWCDPVEDCWYTGADVALTYRVEGIDGTTFVLNTCTDHLDDALQSLHAQQRNPSRDVHADRIAVPA